MGRSLFIILLLVNKIRNTPQNTMPLPRNEKEKEYNIPQFFIFIATIACLFTLLQTEFHGTTGKLISYSTKHIQIK